MHADAPTIQAWLEQVARERARRASVPGLAETVLWLKAYQQRRFERSHADLLAQARHGAAARFFLDDLYGPQDFAERDAQFARIVPALVRLFPQEIVDTVAELAELHALSETLDSRMGEACLAAGPGRDRVAYVRAWQAVGEPAQRQRQLGLVMSLGRQLDTFTRRRWLRQSLRLMRSPARAAGLGALQAFLERGFDTFAAMDGADTFLQTIRQREQRLIEALFAADAVTLATRPDAGVTEAIGELP